MALSVTPDELFKKFRSQMNEYPSDTKGRVAELWQIGLIHGPNLDRLGQREPQWYGVETLSTIQDRLSNQATELGAQLHTFQSAHEGALIDTLAQWADSGVQALIVNFGGLSHTSVSLYDALVGLHLPAIEVHLSPTFRREPFRQTSLTAQACLGQISGLGAHGYTFALQYLVHHLSGSLS